jgi:ABC-type uncharacterized transport system ATPase subunit
MARKTTDNVLYGLYSGLGEFSGINPFWCIPLRYGAQGIGMVQHFMLIRSYVTEISCWVTKPSRWGRWTAGVSQRVRAFSQYELDVDPGFVQDPVGIQQRVKLLKQHSTGMQNLILDEPTAAHPTSRRSFPYYM